MRYKKIVYLRQHLYSPLTQNLIIMDYKIIDIEGVGNVYAEKLNAAGINKVSELLT